MSHFVRTVSVDRGEEDDTHDSRSRRRLIPIWVLGGRSIVFPHSAEQTTPRILPGHPCPKSRESKAVAMRGLLLPSLQAAATMNKHHLSPSFITRPSMSSPPVVLRFLEESGRNIYGETRSDDTPQRAVLAALKPVRCTSLCNGELNQSDSIGKEERQRRTSKRESFIDNASSIRYGSQEYMKDVTVRSTGPRRENCD